MESLIGKTIDGYKILEVLGRGGMGVVLKAIDTSLEKIVALKMIDPFLARDEGFVKRFKTEAKALARLENRNIVRVNALRETDSGLFMVMEYVEAKPLSIRIQENGPFSISESVAISKQLLNAIGHAHQVGVIHRDIKPSNILLCSDGTVKVTDFGLAKVIKQKGPSSTVTQTRAGTLYYMSPEQVKGLKNVDERSDLYSLGMTIYEMLVGRVPFDKTDSDFTIQKKIVDGEIPSPLKFDSNIPKKLTKIIQKSIDKDPDKRYQKAEEILEALTKYENEIDNKGKTPAPTLTESKPIYKKPVFLISVLSGILVLALIYSLFFLPAKSPTNEAYLTIETDPINSDIKLNGENIGQTPIEDFILKSDEEYKLKLTKDGFIPVDTTVSIAAGETFFLKVNLVKAGSEKLTIVTEPAGAMIYLDSNYIGSTPLENYLINPGRVLLRVEKMGFNAFDTTVVIAKNVINKLNINLTKKSVGETGSIKINSVPRDASVWISTEFVGSTPYENSEFETGSYKVLIRKKGFADYITSVKVSSNKLSTISTKLVEVGNLVVSSEPTGAEVYIENTLIGKTNLSGSQVAVGDHKITIRKSGFKPYSSTIKIEHNKTFRISETLPKLIGKLEILVKPFGDIYVNDELRISGTSVPYNSEIPGGLNKLKVVHPSLGSWTKSIDITDENTKTILIDFNNEMKLTVVSEPSFAEIFLNGESTGQYTPYRLKLKPGTYKIQIQKEGYKPSVEQSYTVDSSVYEVGKQAEDRIEITLGKNE